VSRTEPDLDWTKRGAREANLAALHTMRIGPIFPSDPDHTPGLSGTRREARGGKDTKPPYRRSRSAARRVVTASCLSCRWSVSGSTWRPIRRRLAEHVGKRHPKLVRGAA